MSADQIATEEFTKVESIFIRSRFALLLKGHFPPIYTDYYLHRMEQNLEYPEVLDTTLKTLTAGFTLHMAARPWAESIAWTINSRAPRVNYFVTGGSVPEAVVARVFTENVREPDRNFLYSQTRVPDAEPRLSTIEVEGRDPLSWIEQYYQRSEQRPCRVFELDDEEFVMIVAQPDCDLEWLEQLDAEKAAKIENEEDCNPLENRKFRWHCGCSSERLLPTLAMWQDKPDELFGDDEEITISCPRCAANQVVTRQQLADYTSPE